MAEYIVAYQMLCGTMAVDGNHTKLMEHLYTRNMRMHACVHACLPAYMYMHASLRRCVCAYLRTVCCIHRPAYLT